MPSFKFLNPVIRPVARLAVQSISRSRLPIVEGVQQVQRLDGTVEIIRDHWNVAHIYGETTASVLFAQGYVHAQERLWQMDFSRRVVAGRLSEVLGRTGLLADRVMRTLGFRRVAEKEAEQMNEPVKSLLDHYCAGVNAWIDTAPRSRKLPVEFTLLGYKPDPWVPADTLGWAKLMSWTLAGNWESEFLRGELVKQLGKEKASQLELTNGEAWAAVLDAAGSSDRLSKVEFTGPRAGDGVGSNNWAISGQRTATGKPLFANDMHMDLTIPAIWYENHLECPDLSVTGLSIPGVPFLISGHNRFVAWGFTDGFPDVQDLFEERLRVLPGGVTEYEYRGEWLPADVRQEEIRIKGENQAVHEVVVTRHGPIFNLMFQDAYPGAPPLALRWTALEPETTFRAFYEMNRARTCAEFHESLRSFSGPCQNVVYADTQGRIGYTLNGRIPIRARGDGTVPAPGWTGEFEWVGYIPFEKLPHMENPPQGFIATANNVHIRGESEYFIGSDYNSADRAARITELIEEQSIIDIAYIQKMHIDQVSISGRSFARHAANLQVIEPDLSEIVEGMRAWDGSLASDSVMAAIYEVAVRQAIGLVLSYHVGDLGVHVQGKGPASGLWGQHSWEWFIHLLETPDSPWFDLGSGEKRDDVLICALHLAVEYLKQQLGADINGWTWGKLHQLTFRHILGTQAILAHAFNLGPFPIGGDGTTVWSSFTHYHDLGIDSMVGPAFRFIADLSDLDHCWGALVPGQSGHPGSPGYNDGIQPWFKGEYHPMLFKRDEVEKNEKARLILKPKG